MILIGENASEERADFVISGNVAVKLALFHKHRITISLYPLAAIECLEVLLASPVSIGCAVVCEEPRGRPWADADDLSS